MRGAVKGHDSAVRHDEAAAQQIIVRLAAGESVVLVTDAGTPAISDPGARLVARVRAAGFRVVPLPGACAAVTTLSAARIEAPHFLFYGFLPAKAAQRERTLRDLAGLPFALVFYEAPHHIVDGQGYEALALTAGENDCENTGRSHGATIRDPSHPGGRFAQVFAKRPPRPRPGSPSPSRARG